MVARPSFKKRDQDLTIFLKSKPRCRNSKILAQDAMIKKSGCYTLTELRNSLCLIQKLFLDKSEWQFMIIIHLNLQVSL